MVLYYASFLCYTLSCLLYIYNWIQILKSHTWNLFSSIVCSFMIRLFHSSSSSLWDRLLFPYPSKILSTYILTFHHIPLFLSLIHILVCLTFCQALFKELYKISNIFSFIFVCIFYLSLSTYNLLIILYTFLSVSSLLFSKCFPSNWHHIASRTGFDMYTSHSFNQYIMFLILCPSYLFFPVLSHKHH